MRMSEQYLLRALKAKGADVEFYLDLALREEEREQYKPIRAPRFQNQTRANVHMNGCPAAPIPPNPAWR